MPQAAIGFEEELKLEGELLLDHLLGANPAAGQPFVLPLDSRFYWRFASVRFLLSTDATAGNRFVTVAAADPEGTSWLESPALAVQAPSVAGQEYRFNPRNVAVSGIAGAAQYADLFRAWIGGGWQLRISVAGIGAGDTITGIRLLVEKFEPARG